METLVRFSYIRLRLDGTSFHIGGNLMGEWNTRGGWILIAAVLIGGVSDRNVEAQWSAAGAKVARQYFNPWKELGGDFEPQSAVGISSMAFHGQSLFLACEKFPYLIVFQNEGGTISVTNLTGVPKTVDFEAMSIHRGKLYIVDEDEESEELKIYSWEVSDLSLPATAIAIKKSEFHFDASYVRGNDGRYGGSTSDYRSIEGLVVSDRLFLPSDGINFIPVGPYFYLLDEVDQIPSEHVFKRKMNDCQYEAVLYRAVLSEDKTKLRQYGPAIRFCLEDGYRLCELFQHKGKDGEDELYALRTRFRYNDKASGYQVVRLQLPAESSQYGTMDAKECDFTTFAQGLEQMTEKFDSNFEAAAIGPDGRLFLAADNEMLDASQLYDVDQYKRTGVKNYKMTKPLVPGRALTPIIELAPAP